MHRKVQETEIAGHTYQFTQLGAETGDDILFRLGRGLAMSDLKSEDFAFVRNVFKNSTKLLIVDTKGEGRRTWVPLSDKYDDHFAGRYQDVGEWLKVCFEFNFGPFLDVIRKFVVTRMAAVTSTSQSGALGGSGDSWFQSILGSQASPTSNETGPSTTSQSPTSS